MELLHWHQGVTYTESPVKRCLSVGVGVEILDWYQGVTYLNPLWGDVLSMGMVGVEPLHLYETLLVYEPPGGASDAPTPGGAVV